MSVEVARMTNRSGRKRGGSRIAWWTTGGALCVATVLGGWPMHAADEPTPLAVSSTAKPDDAKTGAAAKSDSPASVDSAPASKPSGSATAAVRHWCYQPIQRPALPAVQALEQVQNPIDQLILARLEKLGLKYSPEASRAELLRRLKFDLLGLPPTPEEQTEFANDRSPDAYERLVERFLSSPHYGEKWGRLWLDAVGYADTAGYNADPLRPLAYQYRDYVIAAFNRDLPFDQFVTQQIAGDELQPDNRDALIATGFLRMPPDESNASDVLLARQDQLNQITASVGAVLLGQSLGCAQCHDHKYDELTQRDFYSLQAFFAAVIPVDSLLTGDIATRQKNEAVVRQWLAETAAVREARHQLLVNARKRAASDKRLRYQEIIWTALDTPREQRTAFQHQVCFFAERQVENDYKEKELLATLTAAEKEQWATLQKQMQQLAQRKPRPKEAVDGMSATDGTAMPETFLLAGGNYLKPLDRLEPAFPAVIGDLGIDLPAAAGAPVGTRPTDGSASLATGRRSRLARWLTSLQNPLVPRVISNRLWQGHFGIGLVENSNDFGVQTPVPALPELLDWLAAELIDPQAAAGDAAGRSGAWSLKRMHRLIVSSQAYRQSTVRDDRQADLTAATSADPANHLFWHYPRRRLEAESLRDAILAVSGELNAAFYGPGVKPELPVQFGKSSWEPSVQRSDRFRRSVYIQVKRNLLYPMLQAFDLPDTFESCARRAVTTTAPQALTLLNSELVLAPAQRLAGKLLRDNPQAELDPLVDQLYRVTLSRSPTTDEVSTASRFIEQQTRLLKERAQTDPVPLLPQPFPKFLDPERGAAIVDLCHAILNSNEFVYVD